MMKKPVREVFHTEQEYYQELLDCVRKLLACYTERYVEASDTGLLRHNGGCVVYRDELLALTREQAEDAEGEKGRKMFREELESIRECGKRTIRSGCVISLEYLIHMWNLGKFEAFVVILALAGELDHNLQLLLACLCEKNGSRMPTLSLALRLYTGVEAERRELQRQVLNRWQMLSLLFEDGEGVGGQAVSCDSFFERDLKLEHRIVSYLHNYNSVDETLTGMVRYGYDAVGEQALLIHKKVAEGMDRLFDNGNGADTFFLCGEYASGKKLQAAGFCERHNRQLLLVNCHRLPEDAAELRTILRRIMREAVLQGNAAICIHDLEADQEGEKINAQRVEDLLWGMNSWNGILILTSRYEWNRKIQEQGRCVRKLFLPETTTEDRMLLWKEMLSEEELPRDMNLEFLADKYILSAGCIKNCVCEYRDRLKMEQGEPQSIWLLEACRNQIDHRLGKDAVRIRTQYTWEDLVLPKPQKRMLKDACDQVLHHHQVYHRWGFEEKLAYGKGVSMLFYGPPGTGKTMGAQVIANTLNLELYKVDMAGVMSKYVGESEKKLGNIFEQAKKSQSILFFDEADVLFGKRTEQKDSNDKYSNASTAYLLQKIEEYEGIIILATNFLQNFDNAFLRRFRFIVEFPFTDVPRRKEIWEKVFPEGLPREELDLNYLAEQFHFSGSQIKNVAVAAAFLAAGEQTELTMKHILTAVKREMAKNGKKLIAGDFGPYYYLMEEQEE